MGAAGWQPVPSVGGIYRGRGTRGQDVPLLAVAILDVPARRAGGGIG